MELWIESQDIWFVKIINKMQELEQGSDKEWVKKDYKK